MVLSACGAPIGAVCGAGRCVWGGATLHALRVGWGGGEGPDRRRKLSSGGPALRAARAAMRARGHARAARARTAAAAAAVCALLPLLSEAQGRVHGGQSVRLVGLQARPDLNGEVGVALRFHEESGRWRNLGELANLASVRGVHELSECATTPHAHPCRRQQARGP